MESTGQMLLENPHDAAQKVDYPHLHPLAFGKEEGNRRIWIEGIRIRSIEDDFGRKREHCHGRRRDGRNHARVLIPDIGQYRTEADFTLLGQQPPKQYYTRVGVSERRVSATQSDGNFCCSVAAWLQPDQGLCLVRGKILGELENQRVGFQPGHEAAKMILSSPAQSELDNLGIA